MRRRPTSKTLKSLHITLQRLEQTAAPAETPESMSELKRVVLNRIADLELTQILETTEDTTDKAANPPGLVPPSLAIEEELLQESAESPDLDKLD